MDETFKTMEFATERVVTVKGHKTRSRGGGNRDTITVIAAVCADGTAVPPAYVYQGKFHQRQWLDGDTVNATILMSDSGWVNNQVAMLWLKEVFIKHIDKKREDGDVKDVILTCDRHGSHFTYNFLKTCQEHGIFVMALPAHSSHVIQPLDVKVFGPDAHYFHKALNQWKEETKITFFHRDDFAAIYGQSFLEAYTEHTIKRGFEASGVWPLDREAIPESEFAKDHEDDDVSNLPSSEGHSAMKLAEQALQLDENPDSHRLREDFATMRASLVGLLHHTEDLQADDDIKSLRIAELDAQLEFRKKKQRNDKQTLFRKQYAMNSETVLEDIRLQEESERNKKEQREQRSVAAKERKEAKQREKAEKEARKRGAQKSTTLPAKLTLTYKGQKRAAFTPLENIV